MRASCYLVFRYIEVFFRCLHILHELPADALTAKIATSFTSMPRPLRNPKGAIVGTGPVGKPFSPSGSSSEGLSP